jgi:diadenosine tetraphosphate (Ap4A) HIT family hydrolase
MTLLPSGGYTEPDPLAPLPTDRPAGAAPQDAPATGGARGDDPRFAVAAGQHWTLFLNRDQNLLGRCYLRLNRPETDALNLDAAELMELWALARRVRDALSARWEPDHFNYAFLMNVDRQVHFHVIPRYKARREFAGGSFADPTFGAHYTVAPDRHLDEAAYDAIIAALRQRL